MQRPTFRSSQNLILGLSLVGILCSCSGTSSSSDDAYYPEPSGNSSYIEPEISSDIGEEMKGYQPEQPSTYTIDQMNQDLHEEQIKFEREQLDSKRFGIAQDSIINNYSTFCPSTGPCD